MRSALLGTLAGIVWATMLVLVLGQTQQPTPPVPNTARTDVSNLWADGVKQTFNPSATTAGVNVGLQAGDPSTLANGDLWYDSTGNLLRARIGGASVSLGAGGAGTPAGSSSSVQYNNGGTFGGTSGLTVSGTDITALRYRPTTKNATVALTTTDGPLVACDTSAGNVILTLPAANGGQGTWAIIKTTSDANTCSVVRGGSDTINGGTAAIVLDTQWERMDLVATNTASPGNWSALLGVLTIGTSQIADDAVTYGKMQPLGAASRLLGRGATLGTGDVEEITLGTNLSMSGTTLNATGGGGGGTGTVPLWPGFVTLSDGTTNNGFARSQVVKSTGTPPTNGPNLFFTELLYSGTTDEHAFFSFGVPSDYASGGTFYVNWKSTDTTNANVVFKCAVAALTAGGTEVPNTKVLAAVTTTSAVATGTTLGALRQSTCAPALDSLATRDMLGVTIGRDPDNASDTYTADVAVVNIWFEYTK